MKTMAETDRNVEKPSTSSEPQKPRGTKREDSLSVVGVELINVLADEIEKKRGLARAAGADDTLLLPSTC